ncbi:LacI family DNA-binding transcriptional regulator [Plebeiibacterium sediminum]|uniref:LacI family DNA-binding transcriptional regulator n=1 Tax=Plebeiibacterium sediminum TaxID=2992112 RepID=A0AAE3M158_9BACT|nr:LacI family DNA-binding transcriptional regulator [Plebeiobacterium sediminum]MCW3785302.1 LacI family DNA-binding transcriptional regulator [Plebeiobacterium sediminum]
MKIRIVDIAKQAGVSAGTVDRIIHQRGKFSEKAYEKVQKAIKELGYAPDILARNLALKRELQIACLLPDPNDVKYWTRPMAGIDKAISELSSFKVNIHKITFSLRALDFKEAFNKILDLNPDGVVYVPMFLEESKIFADQLHDRNIPFVQMNIHHAEANPLSFIGQDPVAAGKVAASLCNLAFNKEDEILVVYVSKGKQEYSHINDRIEGFLNFFREKNISTDRIKHLQLKVDKDNVDYEASLCNYLKKSPNTKIIYVPNSRIHLIADILEENNIKDLMLIGFDTLEQNIKYLQKGVIDFLIAQQSKSQGYNAAIILFNYLFRKENVKSMNYLPVDILNKENINFYEGLLE